MDGFEKMLKTENLAVERFVKFRISNKTDADDILQEVYLTAYQKFPQLKSKEAFKGWLLSIARNKCNDYFRSNSKLSTVSLDLAPQNQLTYTRFGFAERNPVSETLGWLSPKDREILSLYYFSELSQAEIAKKLHIPIGTVKSRLHTAKQNFKTKYPYSPKSKGDTFMKKLPEIIPEYTIKKSHKAPFPVKWEELWGLFIIPKIGEKLIWGIYETDTKKCSEWGAMEVTGKAMVHEIEGVEIKECRHNHFGLGKDDKDHYYVAQLTDTHCRLLAENYVKDGVRKYLTFLDGDDFIAEWGYGENNCGKETNLSAKGKITKIGDKIIAENTDQLCDIVGRYTITINGKEYDTVRVLSLDSYYGEYVCCEQYLDSNGRTVLWRRFNRDDWNIANYKTKWSERFPNNDKLTVNGETYVHWYDCITDYIL
ncbi:MAG: RNA polymerase sigma factor [Clostridia bacterium]|nr:RNA polymerase sigma factor [Clostridia bacterium]